MAERLGSPLLRSLVTPGQAFPDMAAALAEMQAATDWEEAEASGRVEPATEVGGAWWAGGRGGQARGRMS